MGDQSSPAIDGSLEKCSGIVYTLVENIDYYIPYFLIQLFPFRRILEVNCIMISCISASDTKRPDTNGKASYEREADIMTALVDRDIFNKGE